MIHYRFVFFLAFLVLTISCKDSREGVVEEYAEFKKKPDYILHPTAQQKAYFDAYDETLKKWGVPYEELYIPTSKGVAHVILSGPKDGVPVVLMHGMDASSTMWYPNARALAKNYRLFAIDLIIEAGKSYKTADITHLDEVVAWYEEVMWALDLDTYHLIGTSRGGWLATNLALKSKRDIRSLILLSPVQTFIWIPPSTALAKNILNVFYSQEDRVERTMETLSSAPDRLDNSYMEQYKIAKENDSLRKFAIQMKPFSKDELSQLRMPVYVLIGDDDMFNNSRTLHLTEKYIPHGKGELIENSGHFLSVDQAEAINSKILGFMRKVDANRSQNSGSALSTPEA